MTRILRLSNFIIVLHVCLTFLKQYKNLLNLKEPTVWVSEIEFIHLSDGNKIVSLASG